MEKELTICTVSYRHLKHLILNVAFTKELNPNSKIDWFIVNNAPDEESFDELISKYGECIHLVNSSPNNYSDPGKASKHHAAGLDLILSQVKTRFVLILDPDFYLIMPNWAECVVKYMAQEGLAMFGVPWHPRWVYKYRYFPCVHCLFIDKSQVDLSNLTFMPEFDDKVPLDIWRFLLSKIPLLSERAFVASSRDTGYRLYEGYYKSSVIRCGLAVPSFSRIDVYNKFYNRNKSLVNLRFLFNKALDRIFPDSMSIVPKRKGYFTKKCFSELGLSNCKSFGWEEFFWNNSPFAFHVRGFQQKTTERHMEIERICNVLQMVRKQINKGQSINITGSTCGSFVFNA